MIVTVTLNPAIDLWMDVAGWRPSEVNRAGAVRRIPGGKGINVSRTLKALGDLTCALTILGSDSVAEFRRLAREGAFSIIYVNRAGETRMNVHILDPEDGRLLKVNQPGGALLPEQLAHFEMLFRNQMTAARWAVLAGSLPPGTPPDAYARLAAFARSSDVPLLVDAQGEPLLLSLEERPVLAKPNRRELEITLNATLRDEADVLEGARELMRRGARSVVVTNGAEPVVALLEGEAFRVHPPAVAGAPPGVGAGDALAAGLVSGLQRRLASEQLLRFAVGTAAASLTGVEDAAAFPGRVKALARAARVERL